MSLDPSTHRQQLAWGIVLFAGTMVQCSSTEFYAHHGFQLGSLPPKRVEGVHVQFGKTVPNCNVRELGTIVYDAAQDYVSWSKGAKTAINNAQERAAEIGASGIYNLQLVPAGSSTENLSMGTVIGIPLLGPDILSSIGMSQSNTAFTLVSTAYACDGTPTPIQVAPPTGDCMDGQVRNIDTNGYCCWPSQAWNIGRNQCVGLPSCPKGFQLNAVAQTCEAQDCKAGRVHVPSTLHCCWPGQSWSRLQGRCVGVPERCPIGMQLTGEACTGNMLCPEGMAYIPPSNQRAGFCLDLTEVTVGAYRNCVSAGRCSAPAMNAKDKYCNFTHTDRNNQPVNCLTAEQANQYCAGMGKRLPVDDEWEWAASSAGQRFPYVWGDKAPERQDLCWEENRGAHSCDVATFPKDVTQQGVFDMAGNLREWTVGPGAEHFVRGGAWDSDGSRGVRVTARTSNPWTSSGRSIGFRCARNQL